ncbi:MAG: hypothetical protein RJA70_243 [Pseudomonadota bacterium]|jgi:hypothetical protein
MPSAAISRQLSPSPGCVIAHTPEFAVYTLERVVVLWWRTEVVVGGANAITTAFRKLVAEGSEPIGFLTIINADCDVRTPAPVRAAISKLLNTYDKTIGAAGIVYGAQGFKATVLRSVITAINLASRSSFPNRVFPDLHHGEQWLTQTLNSPDLAGDKLSSGIASMMEG